MNRTIKTVALFLAFLLTALVFVPSTASVYVSKKKAALFSVLDNYFNMYYDKRATLSIEEIPNSVLYTKNPKEAFLTIDLCLTNWLSLDLSSFDVDLRYDHYNLNTVYEIESFDSSSAHVSAFVACDFSYCSSPDIKSRTEMRYKIALEKDDTSWYISSRTYPSNLEVLFWGEDDKTIENAYSKYLEMIELVHRGEANIPTQRNETNSFVNDTFDYNGDNSRLVVALDRTHAAAAAVNYVNSTPSAPNGYAYPFGYHSHTHDCTNFVSFCLNYGGGIPQDYNGNYTWYVGSLPAYDTLSWINVDYFYTYLMNSTQDSSGGIIAATIYSSASYPSSTYLNHLQRGDIVQFSSHGGGNDWTHSVMVTSISNGIYICGHSAASAYNSCYLYDFYTHYASINSSYYIRLITIAGYRA